MVNKQSSNNPFSILERCYTEMMKEIAIVAGGCFWCTEAIFKRLKGVDSVISGYIGGTSENPTYEEVSTGKTGYAEAIQISFDPSVISYKTLLDVFWHTHNPTTLNQQGNDLGTQYRSAIFYRDGKQKQIAEASMKGVALSRIYADPIVTEIIPATHFYSAETYHKDYYDQNRNKNPYCTVVIDPKISKLLKEFEREIKEEYKNS